MKRTYKEIKAFIEEMGGWEKLEESDIEGVRQRVKSMDMNDWREAYEEHYKDPEVMKKIKEKEAAKVCTTKCVKNTQK